MQIVKSAEQKCFVAKLKPMRLLINIIISMRNDSYHIGYDCIEKIQTRKAMRN